MGENIITYTFGCRMNTFETQCIKQMAIKIGMHNVIIINSCTITNESERQVRQIIRKLTRENNNYTVILTGCASQLHPDFFLKMPEVDFVVNNEIKLQTWVYENINNWTSGERKLEDKIKLQQILLKNNDQNNEWEYIYNFEDRSRAFVPIQTGCNHYCSFCIVPFTRGKFKSFDPRHIIEQIKIFVENGYNEIVLTGIDITDYGKDVRGQQDIDTLGKLCRTIIQQTDLPRLRLSSVDVAEIDDDIIDLIKNEPRFMPYFHISLQSGSNAVLHRMRRRHTYEDVIDFCTKVIASRPEIAFGADIITGFPGETEEEFSQSIKIVKNAPITFIHAFPYSKREKTLASLMEDNVPKKVKKERVNILIKLGEENLNKMHQKMNATYQNLLIERNNIARAENFVTVNVNNSLSKHFGKIIKAKVVLKNNKLFIK